MHSDTKLDDSASGPPLEREVDAWLAGGIVVGDRRPSIPRSSLNLGGPASGRGSMSPPAAAYFICIFSTSRLQLDASPTHRLCHRAPGPRRRTSCARTLVRLGVTAPSTQRTPLRQSHRPPPIHHPCPRLPIDPPHGLRKRPTAPRTSLHGFAVA
jgi:hypothetical protein